MYEKKKNKMLRSNSVLSFRKVDGFQKFLFNWKENVIHATNKPNNFLIHYNFFCGWKDVVL